MRSIAVAALTVAASLTGCGDELQPTPYGAPPTAAPNEEFREGGLAFTVTSVDLGQPKIGNRTPEGTFVVVSMKVRNVGNWPRTVYCQDQRLTDLTGRSYDNAVPVGPVEDMIDIKPGARVAVQCAFDVPVGTLAGAVEVHDQAFSDGVTVRVLSVG
jgi:hypothetical protein